MKYRYDLSELKWSLEGYTPFLWLFERLYGGMGNDRCIDVPPVSVQVPGSVQGALRAVGLIPDWNSGVNYRQCEWIEHRHWIYKALIPDTWIDKDAAFRLECLGLDYSGWVYVNGHEVAAFKGTHIPHYFTITSFLKDSDNVLEIIFDQPPRWLGQFGYTSQMREWKTRFNYTWDWAPRIVQIGIWDSIFMSAINNTEIQDLACETDVDLLTGKGIMKVKGEISSGAGLSVKISLEQGGGLIHHETVTTERFQNGLEWRDLPVNLWWPNLEGNQPLYQVACQLLDAQGNEHDRIERRVGFKHVDWVACEGAPPEADPWICIINGRPVFLQGVNFAPLGVNFADLKRDDYARRLELYQELGCNLFRINACQFLERQWFYDLCDELGLMVWQEFPLTSSGIDNWPPEDQTSIDELAEIASSYIERRRHHVSLLLWSGGNELMGDLEGHKYGMGKPCGLDHPMLKRLQEVAQHLDPTRRFIPTSPSGPRAGASQVDFGKGLHWDVHGGTAQAPLEDAKRYWTGDDALFRSEIYCSGASPVALIKKYSGDFPVFPPTAENLYWSRLTTWWLDWKRLIAIWGREPRDLDEYVEWSQAQQAKMLGLEIKACKDRFPRCGGVLLWSGHDTFPLTINTSLIDFDGNLKPAAHAVAQAWHIPASNKKKVNT